MKYVIYVQKRFSNLEWGILVELFQWQIVYLYSFLSIFNEEPKDWFVLSKGHAGPSYYAALAIKGKISKEDLFTLNRPGTKVPSHPDRNKTNGVDCSTGSLVRVYLKRSESHMD